MKSSVTHWSWEVPTLHPFHHPSHWVCLRHHQGSDLAHHPANHQASQHQHPQYFLVQSHPWNIGKLTVSELGWKLALYDWFWYIICMGHNTSLWRKVGRLKFNTYSTLFHSSTFSFLRKYVWQQLATVLKIMFYISLTNRQALWHQGHQFYKDENSSGHNKYEYILCTCNKSAPSTGFGTPGIFQSRGQKLRAYWYKHTQIQPD